MIKLENKYFIYDYPRNINFKYLIRYCFVKLENIYYRIALKIIHPHIEDKKHYVSICAIFKNEVTYLKEWIEFHKIVGVEHFYMYNNNSFDDYMSILRPYVDEGLVTLIEWPHNQSQLKAYIDCIKNYSKETKWLGFIDIDEFIVPKRDDTVYSFLRNFQNRPVVKLYWQVFGTSGIVSRDKRNLVTEDFKICWSKYDEVGKCFFNTAYDFNPDFKWNGGFFHGMWANYKGVTLPPVNCFDRICQRGVEHVDNADFPIQINHYFTKSFDEYEEKISRGDVFFKTNPHDLEYFYRHEMKCVSADYRAYKYLIKLKLAMGMEIDGK